MVVDLSRLRQLIGVPTRWNQDPCTVVEILEDGPTLVLQNAEHHQIQGNRYGDAQRRVPELINVPVLLPSGADWHPAFVDVLNAAELTVTSWLGAAE